MCDNLFGEIDGHVRDVFMAVQVLLSGRDDRLRTALDEIVHDGQIVGRKVPEHIDVVLEQSQIHARRIVVVELPQRTLFQKLRYLSHRAGKEEGVVHHDLEILPPRQLDQLFALFGIAGEGLFDKDVLPVLKRRFGQFIVRPYRCDHGNGIDLTRGHHFGSIRRHQYSRIGLLRPLARRFVHFRDSEHLGTFQTGEVSHHVRSPVSVTNYAKVHELVTVLSEHLSTTEQKYDVFRNIDRADGESE